MTKLLDALLVAIGGGFAMASFALAQANYWCDDPPRAVFWMLNAFWWGLLAWRLAWRRGWDS